MKKPKNRRVNQTKRTNHQAQNAIGHIRIIAGAWRGRKLPVHDVVGLRPTTDRVKETVFNWLMNSIRFSHCLDCFAGAGALGFEALSRGAQTVTLIEKDSQAAAQLKTNATTLNAQNANVVQADSLVYLRQRTFDSENPYDIVFIDPPFGLGLAEKASQLLEEQQLLAPGALIYVEVESELTRLKPGAGLPANWQLLKQKTAGQVSFSLYQRDA